MTQHEEEVILKKSKDLLIERLRREEIRLFSMRNKSDYNFNGLQKRDCAAPHRELSCDRDAFRNFAWWRKRKNFK